jgi:hypothetical protein
VAKYLGSKYIIKTLRKFQRLVGRRQSAQELYEAKFGAALFSRIPDRQDDCRPCELEDEGTEPWLPGLSSCCCDEDAQPTSDSAGAWVNCLELIENSLRNSLLAPCVHLPFLCVSLQGS